MFSALICVYFKDDPKLFKEAVNSIFNQDLLPDELVLIVDGAVPSSLASVIWDLALKAEEKKIPSRIEWLKENVGHGKARDIGVKSCKFDIIALCDADDINSSCRFLKLLNVMKQDEELSVVGSDIVEVLKGGFAIGKREVKEFHSDIIEDMSDRCPFNQMAVAFRKSHVLAVGGYRPVYNNEDYDLWVRLANSGARFRNIKDVLVYATVNDEFYKRRGGVKYFVSELSVQRLLYRSGYASAFKVLNNILKRFLIQVLMPGSVRKYVFLKFARTGVYYEK